MLRIVSHVIPPIAPLGIGRVVRVAVLLLLEHERPLLVELDFFGPRGKKPRTRRGVAERARRPSDSSGPPYCDSRRPAVPDRTPLRSARCPMRSMALSSGRHERNRGVPFRSEKRVLQVWQYSSHVP